VVPLSGHLARFGRVFLYLFGLLWAATAQTQALSPEVSRGLSWLQSQVQLDGTLANEGTSIATALQAMGQLVDASERLLKITSADVASYRVEVDRLLQEAEARWFIAQA